MLPFTFCHSSCSRLNFGNSFWLVSMSFFFFFTVFLLPQISFWHFLTVWLLEMLQGHTKHCVFYLTGLEFNYFSCLEMNCFSTYWRIVLRKHALFTCPLCYWVAFLLSPFSRQTLDIPMCILFGVFTYIYLHFLKHPMTLYQYQYLSFQSNSTRLILALSLSL